MAIGDQMTTPDVVLLAMKNQLIATVADATVDNVFVSAGPDIKFPAALVRWYTIGLSPQGLADLGHEDAYGNDYLTIDTRLIIALHFADISDDPSLVERYLTLAGSNLFSYARLVIMTMNMFDPVDSEDLPILNQPMRLSEFDWNKIQSSGDIQLAFDINFDWDMVTP